MRDWEPETRLLMLMLAGVLALALSLIGLGISRGALNGYFAAAPSPFPSPIPSPVTTPSQPPPPPPPSPIPDPPVTSVPVTITISELGYVSARTSPGATCTATASAGAQDLPRTITADTRGIVEYKYTPTQPRPTSGTGIHTVSCKLGKLEGSANATYNAAEP
jgi:hypothetical protein